MLEAKLNLNNFHRFQNVQVQLVILSLLCIGIEFKVILLVQPHIAQLSVPASSALVRRANDTTHHRIDVHSHGTAATDSSVALSHEATGF